MCRHAILGTMLSVVVLAGCLPSLPENTKVALPEHLTISETAGAVLRIEPGLEGAYWLEVPYPDGSGTVGGYLSSAPSSRPAIVILLHGASSFDSSGRLAVARGWYEKAGAPFREAGYRTLSLVYTECGTAYGQRDLQDVLRVMEWIHEGGGEAIGVEQTFLFGYSTGGTLINLASWRGKFTAGVSIAGLTQPDIVEQSWGIYNLLGAIYPGNEGMCQASTTVNTYGPPGSPAWDALDTVAHAGDIKSPLLVIQGTADEIFGIGNTDNLEQAYWAALAKNPALPPVEFIRLEGQDHAECISDPTVIPSALSFFERFGQ